jgi:hypothetical protein
MVLVVEMDFAKQGAHQQLQTRITNRGFHSAGVPTTVTQAAGAPAAANDASPIDLAIGSSPPTPSEEPHLLSLIVVGGPSGVGKKTLIARLVEDLPGKLTVALSHTTRQQRVGEVNGVAYHFTNRGDMLAAVARGEFLEHAEVQGNLYGTSKVAVDTCTAQGKVAVLEVDVQVSCSGPITVAALILSHAEYCTNKYVCAE